MNLDMMTGKLIYNGACVCSAKTGEIIHEFTGADLLRGKQYWGAWCVGHFYRIEEETESEYLDDNGDIKTNYIIYVR